MKKILFAMLGLSLMQAAHAQDDETIDISGNNTSSNYISYSTPVNIAVGKTMNVKMARYCYFSSKVTGPNTSTLNFYGGGERCYLGTASGKTWADLSPFHGTIHVYPFPENSDDAGSFGVVLAHGGKSSSADNALADMQSGKVNPTMQDNKVVLHAGATMACEANTSGAGFCIGELNTEEGSRLLGYMKKSRSVYYLVGGTNTDGLLSGVMAPTDYLDDTKLGIVKQGKGTYRITGNDNYLNGALRILDGAVLVNNDKVAAQTGNLRGGLGAMPDENEPIAYVFSGGVLGGTGSIGGSVDNYGTIEPGDQAVGVLTLKNYAAQKNANLMVRPSSRLRVKVSAADSYDQLVVDGSVNYNNLMEDFSTSDKMPVIEMVVDQTANLAIGTEFRVLASNGRQAGDWHFDMRANKYTWVVNEREEDGQVVFVVRLESYNDMEIADDPDDPDEADDPIYTMGAFYDDGVDDATDCPEEWYGHSRPLSGMALAVAQVGVVRR